MTACTPSLEARKDATEQLAWPGNVERWLADGRPETERPAIVTVHSFTPVYAGARREVEFGIIHDADPALARAITEVSGDSGLVSRLNEPYSAADHVTHTLRLHATPLGLPSAMLKLRNDLIADQAAQEAMAERLAPLMAGALERTGSLPCPAS